MPAWLKRLVRREEADAPTSEPAAPQGHGMSQAYLSLHAYLANRYSSVVVLTFAQIEDLLGSVLPNAARVEQDWWENPAAHSTPSPQSQSWMQANRTAAARLLPQVVVFERTKA